MFSLDIGTEQIAELLSWAGHILEIFWPLVGSILGLLMAVGVVAMIGAVVWVMTRRRSYSPRH